MNRYDELKAKVEKEREELMRQKENGEFSLKKHLDNHPAARLVRAGFLPKDHVATKLIKETKNENVSTNTKKDSD